MDKARAYSLPATGALPRRNEQSSRLSVARRIVYVIGLTGLFLFVSLRRRHQDTHGHAGRPLAVPDGPESWCPLPPVVSAEGHDGLLPSIHLMLPGQRSLQVQRLSAAVRVPTQSFDDNGDVGQDPRWDTFPEFHRVLAELFPLVHARMDLRKVNQHGLLYTLLGSEPTLQPILFMAHQDVVPADASAPWTYPPFSGHYDGTFVWGRGSADCKNVLIGLLSVLENLLAQPAFAPRRTILLSFGFDEETSGLRGAAKLSAALEEQWGPDSMLLVLDEGGMGVSEAPPPPPPPPPPQNQDVAIDGVQDGTKVLFAYPGVGEKGYTDLQLTLSVEGGHSSRPPPHTGIGIMSDAIHALEQPVPGWDAGPFLPLLSATNPFRRVLECRVRHAPESVPAWLPHALVHDSETDVALRLLAAAKGRGEEAESERWLMQTSQAVDVIVGGIKVNALPEKVSATVNYRVALHQSPSEILRRALAVLTPVAKTFDLRLVGGEDETADEDEATGGEGKKQAGQLSVAVLRDLAVAPLSPTSPLDSVWTRFAGTLRAVFESTETGRNSTVVPVGNIMTGNTDTAHYWALSRNIYRFSPSREGTRWNAHAIDERMEMTAHLEGMRVYYDLIRNFDSWNREES